MSLTCQEVEAKKVSLEAELNTALEAAKVLTPATAEFDDAYSRYLSSKSALAKIPDELSKAKVAENAVVIATASSQVADAIEQLCEGLKVAELIGAEVVGLSYRKNPEGVKTVIFNPITRVATAGKREAKGTGHTVIIDSEGNHLSLTKFVLAHATEAEKASDAFKYPHTQVDSKPKFESFCEGHSLTGFVYETPKQAEETAS